MCEQNYNYACTTSHAAKKGPAANESKERVKFLFQWIFINHFISCNELFKTYLLVPAVASQRITQEMLWAHTAPARMNRTNGSVQTPEGLIPSVTMKSSWSTPQVNARKQRWLKSDDKAARCNKCPNFAATTTVMTVIHTHVQYNNKLLIHLVITNVITIVS